jgi:uncharacterized protein
MVLSFLIQMFKVHCRRFLVNNSLFSSKYYYPCSVQDLYDWHGREGALERLIPPWENTSVISREGGIGPGGRVVMKMHAGPIPYHWKAEHVEENEGVMFRDVQKSGPFRYWSHSHLFGEDEKGTFLEDHIEYSLPMHSLLPSFVKNAMDKTLNRIFNRRQAILREDILCHQQYSQKPLTVLISGASGILGKALVPFLTTGGHRVYTLVRRRPIPEKNEIYWNPAKMEIDSGSIPEIDGVVHLAGEYIGLGRWTEEKKKRIIESRTRGTKLLAETVARQDAPPKVFLSASAVGYYGDCGPHIMDETQPQGEDFISEVCHVWEKAAQPAIDKKIRTVLMRIGVVLTPQGGALERLIRSSHLGLISRIGSGQQYMSWLTIDDMVSSILHALTCEKLEGPVNFAAPEAVTNLRLLQILSKIINRPLMPTIPVFVLKSIYGQMASEILLSGCRVSCRKLTDSGYQFRHTDLEQAIRGLLGK